MAGAAGSWKLPIVRTPPSSLPEVAGLLHLGDERIAVIPVHWRSPGSLTSPRNVDRGV